MIISGIGYLLFIAFRFYHLELSQCGESVLELLSWLRIIPLFSVPPASMQVKLEARNFVNDWE